MLWFLWNSKSRNWTWSSTEGHEPNGRDHHLVYMTWWECGSVAPVQSLQCTACWLSAEPCSGWWLPTDWGFGRSDWNHWEYPDIASDQDHYWASGLRVRSQPLIINMVCISRLGHHTSSDIIFHRSRLQVPYFKIPNMCSMRNEGERLGIGDIDYLQWCGITLNWAETGPVDWTSHTRRVQVIFRCQYNEKYSE